MKHIRRIVTHKEHQDDYDRGFSNAVAELRHHAFDFLRDKFNSLYPTNAPIASMSEFYYADGYIDGLLSAK